MRQAIELAESKMLENAGGPFGAIILRDDEIIGQGWNQVTSLNDPTAHAEMMAIRDACRTTGDFSLAECDIYCSCEPCPMCLGGIYWARIRRIFYAGQSSDAAEAGFDDGQFYSEFALAPEQRNIPARQLLREEAVEVFKLWNQKSDKTEY
ncbi:MAG: nucleoside deaminase [Planctomycetota bacterium]